MKLRQSIVAFAFLTAACADTLPEQDLRIQSTTPQIKLSADILWKDYLADAKAAGRKYHGQPMLVTGVVTSVEHPTPESTFVMFGQTDKAGVQANLLTDTAAAVVVGVEPKQRITLKCFCDGLSTNVVLRSCVKP